MLRLWGYALISVPSLKVTRMSSLLRTVMYSTIASQSVSRNSIRRPVRYFTAFFTGIKSLQNNKRACPVFKACSCVLSIGLLDRKPSPVLCFSFAALKKRRSFVPVFQILNKSPGCGRICAASLHSESDLAEERLAKAPYFHPVRNADALLPLSDQYES